MKQSCLVSLLLVTMGSSRLASHLAESLHSEVDVVHPTSLQEQYEAIETAMATNTPVFAAPTHMSELPRRVLMALDFSEASVNAAKVSLNLLARPAHALMVSVGAAPEPHIELLFDTVEDVLRPTRDVVIGRYAVSGDTSAALLQVAASQSVDVIAIGRCGRSPGTCAKPRGIGHVTRAIMASASCGVLIAPAPRTMH